MKTVLYLLLSAITVATCQECCTITVVILESSSDDASTGSCNITLSQLINLLNLTQNKSMNCFSYMKIEFQSGIHQLTITENETVVNQNLSFKNISSVVINGQPNATINCQELFNFEFVGVSSVEINSVHFDNCDSGVSFATMHLPVVKIVIVDSNFTNSRAALMYMWYYRSESIVLIIRNVIIENCCYSSTHYSTKPILDYHHDFLPSHEDDIISDSENLNNFTLNSIIVRNNTVPFLDLTSFHKTIIKITGHNYFSDNKDTIIRYYGYSHHKFEFLFSSTTLYFTNNTCDNEIRRAASPIYFAKAKVLFEHIHAVFSNNHGHPGGVISTRPGEGTKIVFGDNTTLTFRNNVGQKGGVIYLDSNSTFIFNATMSHVFLYFVKNTANKGGAIYVEESSLTTVWGRILDFKPVEIRSVFDVQCSTLLVKMTFQDNTAQLGGNHIYGGWVDWFVKEGITAYNFDAMEEILKIENKTSSDIASDPVRICLCEKDHPNCNITDHSIEVYGYVAHLDLVAIGQRYTPVSAYVRAIFEKTISKKSPSIELLQQICTTVSYIVDSDSETLILQPHYVGIDTQKAYDIYNRNSKDSKTTQALLLFHNLTIQVRTKPCPLGFALHKIKHSCVCQPWLSISDLTCEPGSTKISRKRQQWVGITHEHTAIIHIDPGVIVHQNCPFEYCRTDEQSLSFNLEDKDELCAFNRSGILCGGCKANFSRVLGSSECKICTNNLLLLAVITTWLLAGIFLVIFLTILDFTVSTGTINGLIFYANIIHVQHFIFFTNTHTFLSKFISWLNIDQGIELCLYNGLDTYTIAWLQFIFPLYIWTITVILIVSSHYSTRVSRLIGNNAVPVLATLFLITYTKILRLIIDVISFTTITYPDGYKSTVWLIDGNIKFLSKKHIPLFLITLIFLLFSMPFTLILLTIQLLYKISHYRIMFWVDKLKPLFDAYTGPYKAKHRYWTGLLLIVRIALLITFSLNQTNNPTVNLLAITAASVTLLIWLCFSGWVYNAWFNNYLEAFFLTNVGFTSTIVLFELSNDEHSPAAIYVSTGVTFVVFIGIIIYHAQGWIAKVLSKVQTFCRVRHDNRMSAEESVPPCLLENIDLSQNVTSSSFGLTQPLLEDNG